MQQKCKIEPLHLTCITPTPALENSLALPSTSESDLSGPLTVLASSNHMLPISIQASIAICPLINGNDCCLLSLIACWQEDG